MFDSGVGGLSVLRAFQAIAPNERVLYFADTAYFPYGPRSAPEVRKRSFAITQRLLASDVKLIVAACNTASAAALPDLREAFAVPFVGMVPGVKPATQQSRSGRVTILATPGTLDGDLYARVVEGLAELVERGEAGTPRARAAIRSVLGAEVRAGADTVVLGCTHYSFLQDDILAEFPGLVLIDTSEAVARRAVSVLKERNLEAPSGSTGGMDLIVSGQRAQFEAAMQRLGFPQHAEVHR
jgi:glutamate racemase